jgi:hypothetical protein
MTSGLNALLAEKIKSKIREVGAYTEPLQGEPQANSVAYDRAGQHEHRQHG